MPAIDVRERKANRKRCQLNIVLLDCFNPKLKTLHFHMTCLVRQVAQGLWLITQVPDVPRAAEMQDVVYLNELAIEPSAQLKLLHKFAVARLHPAIVQDSLGVHSEDDTLWETETEMC